MWGQRTWLASPLPDSPRLTMNTFPVSFLAAFALLSIPARAQQTSHALELKVGDQTQMVQVESAIKVTLSGWMRVDYGYGNRFLNSTSPSRDELGVSKMALKT